MFAQLEVLTDKTKNSIVAITLEEVLEGYTKQ
jgi:hypothetical protein